MKNFTITLNGVDRHFAIELAGVTRSFEIRQGVGPVGPAGPAGPAGPNSVTSATTSDGTAELSLKNLTVDTDGDIINGIDVTVSETSIGVYAQAVNGPGLVGYSANSYGTGGSSDNGFGGLFSSTTNYGASISTQTGNSLIVDNQQGEYCIECANNSVVQSAIERVRGWFVWFYNTFTGRLKTEDITDDREWTLPDRSGNVALTEDYTDGTATIDVLDATVQGTLTADHIHGNLAGSVYAHIRAGENLAKGDPVYVSGSHGSGATLIPVVSKADASNAAKMPAVGVMDAAVTNNANGHMVITGTITELDTNAYPVNTVLYVATGGGWTSTPPAANSQAVAIVERSNTNNGAVIVKVNGLGSSGGNGAADANKLVRYNSTGGASLSGGTLTDMTYAGTAAFTSTTRPTSAGTGTPAATSLITRADGDARYGEVIYRTIDTTSSNVLSSYDTLFTQTLPVGRYRFEYHVFVKNNEASASINPRIRFTATSGTISVDGVRQSLYNQGSYLASSFRNAANANHDGGNITVGSPNFTEGSLKFFGYINVTTQAVMTFLFTHNTSAPTNPTTVEGHLVIEYLTAS